MERMYGNRMVIDRRRLLVAATGAGLALSLPGARAFAQGSAAPASAAEAPEGAVAWVKYNLNSAPTDQLQAIPGAGERMTREFEEYRPYTSIGQFRGELGKYISPEEVAALEAYLFVPVDVDQADADTLQQLPGVTPEIAQSLIGGRPFGSPEAFLKALGASVAPELATAAATFLAPDAGETATWLKYNLNTATSEQFMAIPGAGERMTREFEEYRPYTSIAQFRGEMGKYISPEEIAALEKYLYVPVAPASADPETVRQLPGVSPETAQTIASEGPFASVEAFLATLETTLAPQFVDLAKPYVEGA